MGPIVSIGFMVKYGDARVRFYDGLSLWVVRSDRMVRWFSFLLLATALVPGAFAAGMVVPPGGFAQCGMLI